MKKLIRYAVTAVANHQLFGSHQPRACLLAPAGARRVGVRLSAAHERQQLRSNE